MSFTKEDFQKLFEIFQIESEEHLECLNDGLLSLEENPDQPEIFEEIFREAHSLKGASRMLGLTCIENLAHHLESILGKVKKGDFKFEQVISQLSLETLDAISSIMADLSAGGEETPDEWADLAHRLEQGSQGNFQVNKEKLSAKPENSEVSDQGKMDEEVNTQEILEEEETEDEISPEESEQHSHLSKEDFEKLFEIFKIETEEHLENLNEGLLSLESDNTNTEIIEEIFREAHSLKGASRMLGLSKVERISHHLETILGKVKKKDLNFSNDYITLLLDSLDIIASIVTALSENGSEKDVDSNELLKRLQSAEKGEILSIENDTVPPEVPQKTTPSKTESTELDIERDLELFHEETEQAHQILVNSLLELEEDPTNQKSLKKAFEQAHGLKGSARIAKHDEMGNLAFATESLLEKALQNKLKLTRDIIGNLYTACDLLQIMMSNMGTELEKQIPHTYTTLLQEIEKISTSLPTKEIQKEQKEKVTPPPIEKSAQEISKIVSKKPKTPPKKQNSSVRVSAEKLDKLLEQSSELLTTKLKSQQRLSEISELIELAGTVTKGFRRGEKKLASKFRKLNHEHPSIFPSSKKGKKYFPELSEKMLQLTEGLEYFRKVIADDNRQFSILIESLQGEVKNTRLLPFQTVLSVFPRMVRDVANSIGKKVKLETSGGNIELDKFILEAIKDPLMHMLRNSVDHGIETPEIRAEQEKPETGTVQINLHIRTNNAVIEICDDGKGLDPEAIKTSAVKKGVLTEKEAKNLKEKQVLNLIFHPGFSTNQIITDISGRGIGMDVVKSNIEKLNGTIDIESTLGIGTTFTLTFPLNISIIKALKIKLEEQLFYLPINLVEKIFLLPIHEIVSMEGSLAVQYKGQHIPFVELRTLLELPKQKSTSSKDEEKLVAILRSGKTIVAFCVDQFLGEEDIVTKGLGYFMQRVRNISGVTIMRNGNIAPLLNVTDLIDSVQLQGLLKRKSKIDPTDKPEIYRVLVVDDSIMTRTMERNLLESYGYQVETAVDGQDALLKLRSETFDIVVSDVQMPNMDGLTLTEQIKQETNLQSIPVILVTALETEEDKKRGIQVGADAYITKSSFDQSNLLDTIKRLIR